MFSRVATVARTAGRSFSTMRKPPSIAEMRTRLLKLDTPHFTDGARDLVKVFPPMTCYSQPKLDKMAGIAHTVASDGHLLAVIKGLMDAKEGEVLIVNPGGSPLAQLGEIFATYAQVKQLAGVIIDGTCRDVDAIGKLSMPFYAKGISATPGGTTKVGKTQIPVPILGVDGQMITVSPGDIIVRDVNGIVSFPMQAYDAVLKAAEAVQQKEAAILEKVRKGHDLKEFFPNFEEHCKKMQNQEESALSFKP